MARLIIEQKGIIQVSGVGKHAAAADTIVLYDSERDEIVYI